MHIIQRTSLSYFSVSLKQELGMKVVIDLNDDKKDMVLNFLESNNLEFEYEYDAEIPQWQIDEIRKRREASLANPDANLTFTELKGNLQKG